MDTRLWRFRNAVSLEKKKERMLKDGGNDAVYGSEHEITPWPNGFEAPGLVRATPYTFIAVSFQPEQYKMLTVHDSLFSAMARGRCSGSPSLLMCAPI